jgi:citrate lyase subunit beta/citryl-CoA lyase
MRSLLFVPGDAARKLEKALASGADALILDLEDSVALSAKETARRLTAEFLAAHGDDPGRPRLYVRINDLASGLAETDLAGVMPGRPDGIVLPKTVGGADIAALAATLAAWPSETGILAIATETARGLLAIGTIPGSSPRLCGIAWGAEDLSADLGAESNRDDDGRYTAPYRHARTMTLLTAAAAEVDAIDTVHTDFRDVEGLEHECRAARRDGFTGKLAIHPAQVPIINRAFAPSAEALAEARRIVAAFADNPGAGVVGLDGRMLDRPHLKRAMRIIARSAP